MFTVRACLLKKQSALNLEEKNAHGSVIYDQWLVLTSSGNKLEEQQFLIWDRLTTDHVPRLLIIFLFWAL